MIEENMYMYFGKIWLFFTGYKHEGNTNLAMCTKSKKKLKKFIISKIKDGTLEYKSNRDGHGPPCYHYGNDNIGKEKQIEAFCSDFFDNQLSLVNLLLDGGYIDFSADGEELR